MDILKLAREAGLAGYWEPDALQRFADLVLEEAAECCTCHEDAEDIRAMKGSGND